MDSNREKLIELLKQKHALYSEVFNTELGKRVLDDLEHEHYIHRSTVTAPDSTSHGSIEFREGQRSVVLRIKNIISNKQIETILKIEKAENEHANS